MGLPLQTGALLLGVRRGTKSGRAQSVRVHDRFLLFLMTLLSRATTGDAPVSGLFSLGGYAHLIERACQGLPIRFCPHGLRAGYVTDRFLAGDHLTEIAEVTRHVSLKSLRVYLDVVSVAGSQASQKLQGFVAEAEHALRVLPQRLAMALPPVPMG